MTVPLVRKWLPQEKRHREEATSSWWVGTARENFYADAKHHTPRIQRSKASTLALGSTIIVGWNATGRKP